jgi:hypothetical protein
VMSSTARETESASSSYCARTEVVTIAISAATAANPTRSASAAAGRPSRLRSDPATGDSAGAIVSATMTGSTMTRTYQSSASPASRAAAHASTRHDQLAARSRLAGAGGRFTARSGGERPRAGDVLGGHRVEEVVNRDPIVHQRRRGSHRGRPQKRPAVLPPPTAKTRGRTATPACTRRARGCCRPGTRRGSRTGTHTRPRASRAQLIRRYRHTHSGMRIASRPMIQAVAPASDPMPRAVRLPGVPGRLARRGGSRLAVVAKTLGIGPGDGHDANPVSRRNHR